MADDRVPPLRLLAAAGAMTLVMLLVAAVGEYLVTTSERIRAVDDAGVAGARAWLDTPRLEQAAVWWAEATLPPVVYLVVLAVAVVLMALRKVGPLVLLTVPVGLFGWWLERMCKLIVARPRPELADPITRPESWAYPSGHSTNVILGAVLVIALVRAVRTRWVRVGTALLCLVVVALTALNRLALGVHYPSDVLAGLILGAALALIGLWATRPVPATGWR